MTLQKGPKDPVLSNSVDNSKTTLDDLQSFSIFLYSHFSEKGKEYFANISPCQAKTCRYDCWKDENIQKSILDDFTTYITSGILERTKAVMGPEEQKFCVEYTRQRFWDEKAQNIEQYAKEKCKKREIQDKQKEKNKKEICSNITSAGHLNQTKKTTSKKSGSTQ